MASALALQCSTSLSYEDPYTGGRPLQINALSAFLKEALAVEVTISVLREL